MVSKALLVPVRPLRGDRMAAMKLETQARDCLYVNWAVPASAAPELPDGLRYERHAGHEEDEVFVSAVLFRLTELHLRALPIGRLSYPQANVRVYVLDDDDTPAVLFLRTLVPSWVAPAARGIGRQPVHSARLRYPQPTNRVDDECWRWDVRCEGSLTLEARLASPAIGPGPRIGSWEATVGHFRQRPRGYTLHKGEVRTVKTAHAPVEVWPLEAAIEDGTLMSAMLPEVESARWLAPHSVWLCPEIPFRFELGTMVDRALSTARMPAAEGA